MSNRTKCLFNPMMPNETISSTHYDEIIAEIESIVVNETYFGDMVAEANIARAALLYRLGKFRDIALSMEKKHETKIHSEIVRAMNSIVVNAETSVRINGVHCSMIVDDIVRGAIPHLKIEY